MKNRFVTMVAIALSVVAALAGCATTGLPKFGAEIGAQSNPMPGGDPIRVPYQVNFSYYGYVAPGSAPDAEVDGKKMYYIYVWIPLVAPELGMRMISPVPEGMEPAEGDFVSPAYAEGSSDRESYFDTWITLERAVDVMEPGDIAGKGASSQWIRYDSNDDSSELPAQPSGSKYNSVLRVVSEPSDPLKALIRGLYRIGFTTYKVGEVQGTFLAQVGAPIDIPGVQIAKTLDDLAALTKE
jgi:hypothetical protein